MLQTLYSLGLKSLQAASEFVSKTVWDLSAFDSWVKVEMSMCLKNHEILKIHFTVKVCGVRMNFSP